MADGRWQRMKLSAQWIRDFVDITVDDRRLAEDLTSIGIAVEGISGEGASTVFEMEIGTPPLRAPPHSGSSRQGGSCRFPFRKRYLRLHRKCLRRRCQCSSGLRRGGGRRRECQRTRESIVQKVSFPNLLL